ncbi:hypothetical protein CDAR_423541 [Caerostris darwini]|uniref:Uncharacterized protein n=1 Tax=Caerostris darwini TaxID=1538125 RepID=A0AAV4WHL3_9ARAC|nr:hypothetical protein CDAR_423541 [Caerostris darwini]
MSTKEILFPFPRIRNPENSCQRILVQKNICASWDNTIGSIIAVSALIAMFSVLSSFGKVRNHEPTNIKGETRLTWFASKYACCVYGDGYACSGRIFSGFFLYLIIAYKYRCLLEDHPVAIYAAVLSIELLVRKDNFERAENEWYNI